LLQLVLPGVGSGGAGIGLSGGTYALGWLALRDRFIGGTCNADVPIGVIDRPFRLCETAVSPGHTPRYSPPFIPPFGAGPAPGDGRLPIS